MKKPLLALAIVSSLLLPVSTAWSGDFIAAREAYMDYEFEEAAKLFLELAREGDHRGQSFMGRMYAKGMGVQKNLAESVR